MDSDPPPRCVGDDSITRILADNGRLCLRSRATVFVVVVTGGSGGGGAGASAGEGNECELEPPFRVS